MKLFFELFLFAVLGVMDVQAIKKTIEAAYIGNWRDVIFAFIIAGLGGFVFGVFKNQGVPFTWEFLFTTLFYCNAIWAMMVNFYELLWKAANLMIEKFVAKMRNGGGK